MNAPFRIGMIGCGTVGTGILELLSHRKEDLERASGRHLQVTRIVVRDPARPRRHLAPLLDPATEIVGDVATITRATGSVPE